MQGQKHIIYLASLYILVAFFQVLLAQSQKEYPQYLDSTQPIHVRVEDLLGRMTIVEKISLNPGEKKTVTFKITHDHLKMLDRNMNWVVEPGEFQIMVGSSSEDIRLKGIIFCN
jgi:hypothetical protein